MQKESFFLSLLRSLLGAFLATVGVLIGLFIVFIGIFSMSPLYESGDSGVSMEIMPDAKGNDKIHIGAPVVLHIDIDGMIGDTNLNGPMVESFLRASKRMIMQDKIKAIILNISSPGGTVVDSNIIYQALMEYKKENNIPIYAYTPGLCASGGYYIACAAEKINASSVSIIGSVGTKFGPMFNFWEFMEKHGINSITLTDGKFKEKYPAFSKIPTEKGKGESYQDLIEITKESYVQFVDLVVKAREERGLRRADLVDRYGARVFIGPTAQSYGYVDNGNSSYRATLMELLDAAKIDPEENYQVVRFVKKRNSLRDIVTGHLDEFSGMLQERVLGLPRYGKWHNKHLYYYDPGNQ